MIDREDLPYISNILGLKNQNKDVSILYDILTAIKENDSVHFLTTILKNTQPNTDISLLQNVFQIIKDNPSLEDDLLDSFSNNQFASKGALLDAIDNLDVLDTNSTIVIWGSWYGSILIPRLSEKVRKIVCIDLDNQPLQLAKNRLFADFKNVEYICDDIFSSCRKVYAETNLIINTSCEHMPPMKDWPWFGPGALKEDGVPGKDPKLSSDCYFAFQSNNMFGIEGHINCVNSLDEFKSQLPERAKVLYEEEVEDTRGIRYMLVGKFMPL